jgi:hypothetical protein
MSHVDDGILHAYLDGELSAVERARLEAHLAECSACRTRLEEERALIGRAAQLLAVAAPPERAAPPLGRLGRGRARRRFVVPLTWAATVALALMTGWYARGGDGGPGTGDGGAAVLRPPLEETPVPLPSEQERARASAPAAAGRAQEPTATALTEGAQQRGAQTATRIHDTVGAREADKLLANAADEPERAEVGVEAPAPAPVATPAAAPAPVDARGAAAPSAAPRAAAERRDRMVPRDLVSTTWRVIGRQPASTLLGTAPVAVPGLPIRELRESPLGDGVVLVEQQLAAGEVIQLFQRRAAAEHAGDDALRRQVYLDGEPRAPAERLARYVGGLRVEIAGPLDTDSLNKLLERVRPIP